MTKRLLAVLASRPEPEFRVSVLKRLARQLGQHPFPRFLKLLLTTAESDDSDAKTLLADTLAEGLRERNLPCGELNAWGAGAGAVEHRDFAGQRPTRSLGPIEYLTVWSCQQTERLHLTEATSSRALSQLVGLCNYSDGARRLYPTLLQHEYENSREGTYSKASGRRLEAIARCWMAGQEPAAIAAAAIASGQAAPTHPNQNWVIRDL